MTALTSAHITPWADADLPLLAKLNGDPAMMEHLGGPESPEKIVERHARYLRDAEKSPVFSIVDDGTGEGVGWVGYWERVWRGETVFETGWSVIPTAQGHGYATIATTQVIALAKSENRHRYIHAFPSIGNGPSNAICRKAGFTLLEECEIEYPPGCLEQSNNWRLDLRRWRAAGAG